MFRSIIKMISALLAIFIFQSPAVAALDLELTQGVSNQLPIAIVPFAGQNEMQAPNNVSTVINNDLRNSGQFKVMDSQNMSQNPHKANDVNANYWRSGNVDNVVVGEVKSVGSDRYQVNFALVNVVNGQGDNNRILTTKEFIVPARELRSLAHHISDLIYQQLTGVQGIFSTRIAYVLVQRNPGAQSKYILQVADMDGYNAKPLLTSNQPIMSPAWAHDGKRIAYVSFENITPRIYIQNVATGSRQAVSDFPGINGAPAWSPDDKKLAIVLSKEGNPKIYTMNLATHSLRQITQGTSIDTEPSFSPDGSSLLFTSDRGGGPQIYQVSVNGGDIKRLTFHGSYNARASFSADGQSIVMINREQGMYNIAVQDLSSGNVQVLTTSGYDASPSFAPNGRMVLYESNPSQRGILGMVSVDGRVRLQIPAQGGSVQDPAWSPFLS